MSAVLSDTIVIIAILRIPAASTAKDDGYLESGATRQLFSIQAIIVSRCDDATEVQEGSIDHESMTAAKTRSLRVQRFGIGWDWAHNWTQSLFAMISARRSETIMARPWWQGGSLLESGCGHVTRCSFHWGMGWRATTALILQRFNLSLLLCTVFLVRNTSVDLFHSSLSDNLAILHDRASAPLCATTHHARQICKSTTCGPMHLHCFIRGIITTRFLRLGGCLGVVDNLRELIFSFSQTN